MQAYVVLSAGFILSVLLVLVYNIKINKISMHESQLPEKGFLSKAHTETLRGIVTVGIVVSHFATNLKGLGPSGIENLFVRACLPLGAMGVDCFLFFSGYGNAFSISKEKRKSIWLFRKCISLLIVYLVCFALQCGALLLYSYKTSLAVEFSNILRLNMPRTAAWYVKIQIILYILLVFSELIKHKIGKLLFIFSTCAATSIILLFTNHGEHWWMSNLCFALGVGAAMYKSEIIEFVNHHLKAISAVCVLLFFPLYFITYMVDFFVVKIIGNTLIVIVIVFVVERLKIYNRQFSVIGKYSLPVYLIHSGLTGWVISQWGSNIHIALLPFVIIVASFLAKLFSDFILSIIKV